VAAAIVGMAVVVAVSARDVIDISIFMLGLSSAELTANWAQWWWWRFNGKARLAASFGGPLIFLFNQFVLFRHVVDAGPDASYVVVFASMAATCLLWILVARFTAPEPMEKLVEFYRRADPMGWWGPVAREAGIPQRGALPIVRGIGIAAVGATMVGSAVIALSCAYVARWTPASIALILSAAAAIIFHRSFSSIGLGPRQTPAIK
jgi:SSS family solute:Na+ symporter